MHLWALFCPPCLLTPAARRGNVRVSSTASLGYAPVGLGKGRIDVDGAKDLVEPDALFHRQP